MQRFVRRSVVPAALAVAVIGAACAPVTPPAPTKPPTTTPTTNANATTCAAPIQGDDGKTEYLAVVDDGTGPTEAVTFDAATDAEKNADVAHIESTEGDVVAVEPDYPVELQVDPNDDPHYGSQWAIGAAGFVGAWVNVPGAGAGVKIAELDTGVFAGHQDLGAAAVLPGTDRVDGTTDGRSDPHGHGTHVAGILGMRDNTVGGVGGAPAVQIFPVRVLNADGSGTYSAIINGINDAMTNNVKVISMSLGGGSYSQTLQNKVTEAINAGIVVVAAAGNNGSCSASYPGALAGVISVASTDNPGTSLSSFSQRGSKVDIAAPGRNILSTVKTAANAYNEMTGTSMATPYVAAAAALLKAKCPAYTPAQVEARLQSTTSPKIANIEANSGALRADLATQNPC